MEHYVVYLTAQRLSELLLVAYARQEWDGADAKHQVEQAHERFSELAAALGYRVEKIEDEKEAA